MGEPVNRALLIHAGAIGDFVMSLRVIAALRNAGADHVTLLGKPHIADLAPPPDGADEVIDIEVGGAHALFSEEVALPAHLAKRFDGIDLAIDMLGGSCGTLRKRLTQAGIPRVIDLDPRPRPDWKGHITEQWLTDLRAAGLDARAGPPAIRIGNARRHGPRQRTRIEEVSQARSMTVLHPGSGAREKCWPLESFLELATRLREAGGQARIMTGPVEAERWTAQERAHLAADPQNVVEGCSLPEAAEHIAAADRYIGNDSGISHLAAALGVPTVAIFGPTDPDRWRPLGPKVIVARSPRPGSWPKVADILRMLP